MRRSPAAATPDVVEVGPIKIDQPRHAVTIEGREVHLTPIEFKLLLELAKRPGRVLTHRQLLVEVWGPNAAEQTHYLRVHMAALRRKVEADPAHPKWLLTEAGVGYRLREVTA
jgi:two-component system, OmpR family, KDP operon response regulator KdpE